MPKKRTTEDQNITPLRVNKLSGRMLRLVSTRSRREILVVYDLHTDLEAIRGFAKNLSRYGSVTAPDLPGFGGMDSLTKMRHKITLGNYCAYLAAFVKLRYRNRRFTIVGIGLGATISVRMLQKYPDIAAKVNNVVLLGGLFERSDRRMSSMSRLAAKIGYKVLLLPPICFLGKGIMRGPFLRVALGLANIQSRPMSKSALAEEDRLWRGDDLKSHLSLEKELLTQKLIESRLNIPAQALAINTPKDFDYSTWSEHLRVIFNDVTITHSRRKVSVPPKQLFEQLTPDIKKFLRQ